MIQSGQPPGPARDVTIVGLGASAGGLAAFEAFFAAMPAGPDPGLAFVLVQHLAPDHESLLTALVQRRTTMTVVEVEDGMRIAAGTVYVIPPNRDLAVLNGTLHLLEPAAPRGLRLPIDFFFRSLAQDQHERAIGIVLSGTGSDGTLGARAIKGEGGMLMAQTPESTEFDGMPRSVIATGLVDYVLPPGEMPKQLVAFAGHRFKSAHDPVAPGPPDADGALKKIFVLLRAQIGHDFSQYKQPTVIRRIERRMAVHQIGGLADYARYLQEAPTEAHTLFADLLIGVTSFFRDPETFKALEEQVIARIFDDLPDGGVLRAWTAGCSTGEEAYSIAMLLQERLDTLKRDVRVQFFATDIDRRSIEVARAGVYPASIAADVSAERLARFFVQGPDGSYRVQRALRDLLVFSEQDVIKDPPFSRLDLISCRNLLIYMGPELHERLIPLFHYALNPRAVLLLGSAESVGEFSDLFAPVSRGAKLFRRHSGDASLHRPALQSFRPPALGQRLPASSATLRTAPPDRLRELTEQALLRHGPAAALVNERGDLFYLHGRTGAYLEMAPGAAAMNILAMAREGLRRDLGTALHDAAAQKAPAHRPGIVIKINGGFSRVDVTVRPAEIGPKAAAEPGLFVVILDDVTSWEQAPALSPGGEAAPVTTDADARILTLTEELRAKEDYLRTSNEELATSNEELKASNEEMQSINEELQSANEELETSKEELQSINEELATVNAEFQTKMGDLARANNDLSNLLTSTGMGTVFVNLQLRIQRFTPAITQVINLIPGDLGRPVGHLVSNLVGYDSLVADIQAVLDELTPREIEVQTRAGAWFLLRIRPYRTLENVIEGAVITFTDITDMKQAQAVLQESEGLRRLAIVVRDSRDAVLVQALDGRILAWNPCAVRTYGWSEAEALTMNIRALIPEPERESALARVTEIASADRLAPYAARRLTRDGRVVEVWLTAAALVDAAGVPYGIATTERSARGGTP